VVFGDNPDKSEEKEPVAEVGPKVVTLLPVVGFGVVDQQCPLCMTLELPILEILPEIWAVSDDIFVAEAQLTTGEFGFAISILIEIVALPPFDVIEILWL